MEVLVWSESYKRPLKYIVPLEVSYEEAQAFIDNADDSNGGHLVPELISSEATVHRPPESDDVILATGTSLHISSIASERVANSEVSQPATGPDAIVLRPPSSASVECSHIVSLELQADPPGDGIPLEEDHRERLRGVNEHVCSNLFDDAV